MREAHKPKDKNHYDQIQNQEPPKELEVRTYPVPEVALHLLHTAVEQFKVRQRSFDQFDELTGVHLATVATFAQQADRFRAAHRTSSNRTGQIGSDLTLDRQCLGHRLDGFDAELLRQGVVLHELFALLELLGDLLHIGRGGCDEVAIDREGCGWVR